MVPTQTARRALDATTQERLVQLVRDRLGTEGVAFEPLAAGLGTRHFVRIRLESGSLPSVVARIDEPEDPAIRPAGAAPEPALEPLRKFLEAAGLPVPASYGRDAARGIDLLEDLGSESLAQTLEAAGPGRRKHLIREACRWIPRLQSLARVDGIAAFDRRLDATLFRYKAEQVIQWVLPRALPRPVGTQDADVVRVAFEHIADHCKSAPLRLAHRDYQSTNLHLRPGGKAGAELAMIDFQGAFLAPPEYDLVCLLQDPHAGLDEHEIDEQLEAVRTQLPDAPTREDLRHRFHLLTLTRCGKDLSRYLYAAEVRGDDRFTHLQQRLAGTVQHAAQAVSGTHACLANLAELFAALPRAAEGSHRVEDSSCER